MRLLGLLFLLVALAAGVDAKFAATQGFSGKHGVTCTACHNAEPLYAGEEVRVELLGLPAAWDAGRAYELVVRVLGGPPGNPAPGQPQAGFDLEADRGSLSAGAGMEAYLRFPTPLEATYTGLGTTLRTWRLVWTSPDLNTEPAPAAFWLAGLAANGNHVMGGPEIAGERGDRAAFIALSVSPSEETVRAWRERPVPPPLLDAPTPFGAVGLRVTGRVVDWADGAEWRLDDGEWNGAIGAPSFWILLDDVGGASALHVRAVADDRSSDATLLALPKSPAADATVLASDGGPSFTPGIVWLVLVGVLLLPLAWKLLR